MQTPSRSALDILLAGGPDMDARLSMLASRVNRVLTGGNCPECGNLGPHDSNGCSGDDLAFCCSSCGEHFGPGDVDREVE